MSYAHENRDHRNHFHDLAAVEPSERSLIQLNIGRPGKWREVRAAYPDRIRTPDDQKRDHHGCNLHDAQRLVARLWNTLDVFIPEIKRNKDRKKRGRRILGENDTHVEVGE